MSARDLGVAVTVTNMQRPQHQVRVLSCYHHGRASLLFQHLPSLSLSVAVSREPYLLIDSHSASRTAPATSLWMSCSMLWYTALQQSSSCTALTD